MRSILCWVIVSAMFHSCLISVFVLESRRTRYNGPYNALAIKVSKGAQRDKFFSIEVDPEYSGALRVSLQSSACV